MDGSLTEILAPYKGEKGVLIPVLQKIQEKYGYISEEAVKEIERQLGVSKNETYGVATFYAQFRFVKPGEHMVRVCLGTACHVRGGPRILEEVERSLVVESGKTTADGKFTLERVACFGCCALAPVMVVDKEVYSRMSTQKVKEVLTHFR